MFRRSVAGLALASILLAACGTATPAISDPREIVTQGFAAMAEVKSFHMELNVDGTVSMPALGNGEITLNGTTLAGDVDVEGHSAHLTFAMPSMLSLSGEMLFVGGDGFVRTSMTGEKWIRTDASGAGIPVPATMDPADISTSVDELLARDGVELEKLDDADCGDGSCYSVRLTVPASVMDAAASGAGFAPEDFIGDSLVLDMLFDRESKYLSGVSTSFSSDAGSGTLTLSLSDFGESVDISPPPSDQVTDGSGAFPF